VSAPKSRKVEGFCGIKVRFLKYNILSADFELVADSVNILYSL
jgi:hypothetical protein